MLSCPLNHVEAFECERVLQRHLSIVLALCQEQVAGGLKTTRLVTMKLLFQMTAMARHGWQRVLAVPIWAKYGVGWSRYASPFFVFATIDAALTGHWVGGCK